MRFGPLLSSFIGLCASAAAAQEAETGAMTVYAPSYFAPYSPSTALDVVRRIPGFTLELVSQDVRGFGQAAGNVVIDGARPSSKTDTLEAILARIPATNVARVEVGPGELFGSEYSAKAQVANLILTSRGGLSGTVTGTIKRDFTGQISPDGSVSALYRRGASTFNFAIGLNNNPAPEEGFDRVMALPSSRLTEFRCKLNDIDEREIYASGSWAHDEGAHRAAHANFRVARNRFQLQQYNDVFPISGPIRDDRLGQDYKRRDFEIGGDITRPLWDGGLKLIGLATRTHRDDGDVSVNRIDGQATGGYAQSNVSQRNETLARLVWSRPNPQKWNIEAGAEGVLNSLDSDVNLYAIDGDGHRSRIDLPVDQVSVKEWRGELFVNAGRSLSSTTRMDLSLTYEASSLTVRGDTRAYRALKFLKPKAVFDWKKNRWHAQLSIERTVAQLNFDDFVSAAELTNDRVDAGNPDIVPQRAWEMLLTVDRPILGDGLAKIELGYNRISLLQDRVPLPEGFDAPGNLGGGMQRFVRGTLTAPLTRFGLKGARLDLSGTLQKTAVEDPYTGKDRAFSGVTSWEYEARFRHDLGKFGWGLSAAGSPALTFFWRDETDHNNGKEPYVTGFAEYRPDPRTTVTFGLDNIFQVPGTRTRTFYLPDRRNSNPSSSEYRERNPHILTYIRLKRSFG